MARLQALYAPDRWTFPELLGQDGLQAAQESVEKIAALEDHIDRLEDALNESEAAKADLRMELDSLVEDEVHQRKMNDFYAGLLSNIQEQIAVAGSRPGSSASARDGGVAGGGQHMEDLMGVVRQSLGACPLSSGSTGVCVGLTVQPVYRTVPALAWRVIRFPTGAVHLRAGVWYRYPCSGCRCSRPGHACRPQGCTPDAAVPWPAHSTCSALRWHARDRGGEPGSSQ